MRYNELIRIRKLPSEHAMYIYGCNYLVFVRDGIKTRKFLI